MADNNKTVILGIELDVDELVANAAKAREEIQKLKDANKELAKSAGDNSVAIEQNKAKIREHQQVLKTSEKQIDAVTAVNKKNTGSITEMRAQLSAATIAYNNLSKEQRVNTKAGTDLMNKIKGLSDELKENESAIGDNRRNVGNYAEAIQMLPGGLGNAGQAVIGLGEQFKNLQKIPILLMISLIIQGLGLLKDAFTSTDSGATEFDARMAQLQSTFGVVKEKAATTVSAIGDLFSGKINEAGQKFADVLGVTSNRFSEAADSAYNYVYALDALEDAEKAYTAQKAVNENKIAKLEYEAANVGNTPEKRKAALDQAIELERKETDVKKKFAEERFKIEAQKLAGTTGINAKTLQDFVKLDEHQRSLTDKAILRQYDRYQKEFQALTDFYAKSVEADTEFFENTKKLNAKGEALQNQIDAERKQKAEEAAKAKEEREQRAFEKLQTRLKDEKAMLQVQVMDSIKGSVGEFNNKVALLEKEKEIELSQKGITSSQKLLIERNYQEAVKKLTDDTIKANEDKAKKALEDRLKGIADGYERQRILAAGDTLTKKQALDELYEQGLISETKYQEEIATIEFDAKQKSLQIKADELAEKAALEQAGSTQRLAMEQQAAEIRSQIRDNEKKKDISAEREKQRVFMQSANARLQVAQGLFGTLSSLVDQGSEEWKAFNIAQIIASTAQGAMGAFAQASTAFPPPYGQIVGAIAASLVAAQGAFQIGKVNDAGFYDGGYTGYGNPREESRAVGPRPYVYHKREYVVPHQVLESDRGSYLVSQLEGMRTKRSSGISGYYDGGFANRFVSAPVEQASSMMNIQSLLSNMPAPIVTVEDINAVAQDRARVVSKSSI